ncbi:AraC family transcriptional regulator of adaptative response / methylphosphotriester-DNA alkyltransferase methyltransferase [Peribacillus cavernae]|nr:AraC family transcriptional regulator of adaptative response / methylphosphotriester-DNA alkyltransferase methyltransferase [Peribacillus cavernae]
MDMDREYTQDFVTDEKWQAIINNDASYNGQFYYAVKTTGIFCRPSCKSRAPKRENVRIFKCADQALAANYRPCKRCKPTREKLPDSEWIAHVTQYIDKNYMEKLNLDLLAEISHGSPYHMHRIFKKVKGITPVEFIQQVRIKEAIKFLIDTEKGVSEIALAVGIPNTSYFITLFKKKTGVTPAEYRKLNKKKYKMEGLRHGIQE